MKRALLVLALVVALAAPVRAGVVQGMVAYYLGDYTTALREFRPLADHGNAQAQYYLGAMYHFGQGVAQDYAEALRWYRLAVAQGNADAQSNLGLMYTHGTGVAQNDGEAVKWLRLAVKQRHAEAHWILGNMYADGRGVRQNDEQAVRLYHFAAEQGDARAQFDLGLMYWEGRGIAQDYIQAHMWYNLSAAATSPGVIRDEAARRRDDLASMMSPAQIARAQELARNFVPRQQTAGTPGLAPFAPPRNRELAGTGSGFAVSKSHVLTNAHVVTDCTEVRTKQPGAASAKAEVIARDGRNDLALIKVTSVPASVATFRAGFGIRQGDAVVAVGFPLHGVLASEANVTTGTVSALAGIRDDSRQLQITAPVQPGNSGGPLLDLSGNVVGIVVAKLDALKVAGITGDIPQNVNFAIKAELATLFLSSNGVVVETAPSAAQRPTAEIADKAKAFTLLIECWK